jgi:DNA-binding MarR family transcriptional regulator
MFTQIQKQIIDGSLLGDGTIWTNFTTPNNKFQKPQSKLDHRGCDKQSYMDWHMKAFGHYSSSVKPNSFKGVNGKIYHRYTFTTHMDVVWNEVDERWYQIELVNRKVKRTKIIPQDLKLTPLTLCVWHMDDGCNNPKDANIELNTQGFTVEEVDFLIDRLDEDLSVKSHKKKEKRDQYKIYVGHKSYFDFMEMIKPHISWDCFRYKTDTSAYTKKPHRGETHSTSKLTEKKIKQIFKLRDKGWLQREIAEKLKMSQASISMILSGDRWQHLGMKRATTKKSRLTTEKKALILKLNAQGLLQKDIAEQLNINQSTVSRISGNQ